MGCAQGSAFGNEKAYKIDTTNAADKSAVELLRLPRKSKKYSVASVTDHDLSMRESFSSKTTEQFGDPVDFERNSLGLGYACRKGRKNGGANPNQDSWLVLR